MSAPLQLPPGIVLLERGWLSSNNVVFTTGTTAVVDSGYVTHAGQTVALVRRTLGGNPLELVVNTHLHSDHCGGNAALRRAYPRSRTLIPPGDADAAARWDEDTLTFSATGQRCERFSFDGLLIPGTSIRMGELEWEVHAAPGHDPHSIILFEPRERLVISADALWENGFGVVFPELDGASAFDQVAATLDVIESLRPWVVIPGHGSTFAGDEAIASALQSARGRLASFVAKPQRHAAHAMKVLIKFKLLEWQRVSCDEFNRWAQAMPYMQRIRARFFPGTDEREWLDELLAELGASGAVRREGEMLYNT